MKKSLKKMLACALTAAMAVTMLPEGMPGWNGAITASAASLRLNKNRITITVGEKKKLKVKGANGKKVSWRSYNKKIASVSKKGVVTGKKSGLTTIVAKVKKRRLVCYVGVNNKDGSITKVPGTTSQPDKIATAIPAKTTTAPIATAGAGNTEANRTDPVATESVSTVQPTATPHIHVAPTGERTDVSGVTFHMDAYNPANPNQQFLVVYATNQLDQTIVIESEAFITTKGYDYKALLYGASYATEDGTFTLDDGAKIEKVEIPAGVEDATFTYDSWEYVTKKDTAIGDISMWWLPSDANSEFTFFFWIGNQRYLAVCNYDKSGNVFYKANAGDVLEPFQEVKATSGTAVTATPGPQKETPAVATELPTEDEDFTPIPTRIPMQEGMVTPVPVKTPEVVRPVETPVTTTEPEDPFPNVTPSVTEEPGEDWDVSEDFFIYGSEEIDWDTQRHTMVFSVFPNEDSETPLQIQGNSATVRYKGTNYMEQLSRCERTENGWEIVFEIDDVLEEQLIDNEYIWEFSFLYGGETYQVRYDFSTE